MAPYFFLYYGYGVIVKTPLLTIQGHHCFGLYYVTSIAFNNQDMSLYSIQNQFQLQSNLKVIFLVTMKCYDEPS